MIPDTSGTQCGFCRPSGTQPGCDVNPRVETRGYSLSSLRDSIRTRRESRLLLSLTEPDVCVTRIRGLKAGAIFFRPCGTEFARGATACPRSDRMGSPVDGEHGIPDNPNGPTPNGVEQICIPCPKLRGSNPPPAAFGGHPRQRGTQDGARIHLRQRGTQDGARIHLRPRVPVLAALKGRPRRAWGLARGSAARPG